MTMAEPELNGQIEGASRPFWHPDRFDFPAGQLRFVRMDREAFRRSTFLDHRTARPDDRSFTVELDALGELSSRMNEPVRGIPLSPRVLRIDTADSVPRRRRRVSPPPGAVRPAPVVNPRRRCCRRRGNGRALADHRPLALAHVRGRAGFGDQAFRLCECAHDGSARCSGRGEGDLSSYPASRLRAATRSLVTILRFIPDDGDQERRVCSSSICRDVGLRDHCLRDGRMVHLCL